MVSPHPFRANSPHHFYEKATRCIAAAPACQPHMHWCHPRNGFWTNLPRHQGFIQCIRVYATAAPATREKPDQQYSTARRRESVVSFLCSSLLPLDLNVRPSSPSSPPSPTRHRLSLRNWDNQHATPTRPRDALSLSNRAFWLWASLPTYGMCCRCMAPLNVSVLPVCGLRPQSPHLTWKQSFEAQQNHGVVPG